MERLMVFCIPADPKIGIRLRADNNSKAKHQKYLEIDTVIIEQNCKWKVLLRDLAQNNCNSSVGGIAVGNCMGTDVTGLYFA